MVFRPEGPWPSFAMNLEGFPFERHLVQVDHRCVRCCERVRVDRAKKKKKHTPHMSLPLSLRHRQECGPNGFSLLSPNLAVAFHPTAAWRLLRNDGSRMPVVPFPRFRLGQASSRGRRWLVIVVPILGYWRLFVVKCVHLERANGTGVQRASGSSQRGRCMEGWGGRGPRIPMERASVSSHDCCCRCFCCC